MFEFLTRIKIYETINVEKKNQLIQKLNENSIDYIVRKEDVNHRSALDGLKMRELMVKPKYVYVFWVKKAQLNEASFIIKSMNN